MKQLWSEEDIRLEVLAERLPHSRLPVGSIIRDRVITKTEISSADLLINGHTFSPQIVMSGGKERS